MSGHDERNTDVRKILFLKSHVENHELLTVYLKPPELRAGYVSQSLFICSVSFSPHFAAGEAC